MAFFMSLSMQVKAADPLVLTSHFLPPLSNETGTGQLDSLIRTAFEKLGYDIRIDRYEQVRSLELARDNKVDGHFARIGRVAEMNDNLVAVSYPIYKSHFVAIAHDPDLKISGWKDIKDYRVHYLKGWKIFDNNPYSKKYARPIIGPNELAKLFKDKRSDLVLYEWGIFPSLAAHGGITEYYQASPILEAHTLHLLLNIKHQELADQLAIVLKEMHDNGEYLKICPDCAEKLNLGS